MQTAAVQPRPIQTNYVTPAQDRDVASERPTETRYGWCPFGDIQLTGPDGTMALYAQPHEIDGGQGFNVPNPYHRVLPKGQLIPFPTFNYTILQPSDDLKDNNGRARLVPTTSAMTALDAIVTVLRQYSAWGFTMLRSLQGLEQDVAMRIFQVVQPFDYHLSRLELELAAGAEERIESREPLRFPEVAGYTVAPLKNEREREIARQLATEMEVGAGVARDLADTILNDTETSMTSRFAGGQGKTGPDPLDRRLSTEMERDLPKLIGSKRDTELAEIKEQVGFLATREASRADKERIAELEARIAEMEAGKQAPVAAGTGTFTCGAIKGDGEPCKTVTDGGRCKWHPDEQTEE